jgi:hypothetical protein
MSDSVYGELRARRERAAGSVVRLFATDHSRYSSLFFPTINGLEFYDNWLKRFKQNTAFSSISCRSFQVTDLR